MLSRCDLCGHHCGTGRLYGGRGACRVGDSVLVSSYGPHFGEEEVLVGRYGSGTIFFSGCNLQCVFCQNWEISHEREGRVVTLEELGEIMLELQEKRCHNLNLVTPTPYLPGILAALEIATARGLNLPLVYNCGGYESTAALKLLDGIVDIYMPDVKFASQETARRLTGAKEYFTVAKAALKEMRRQVGDLELDEYGLARRGLMVRHLVLPGGLSGTEEVVQFLAREISPDTYINIMDQYYPAFQAKEFPPLDRRLRREEYEAAIIAARAAGLRRLG
ncbi:MAG: radical SAM protein [Firmicutes bacterium]|nr:radical SAM protein [Bacillota bacterium]